MNLSSLKTVALVAAFLAKHQAEIRQVIAAVEVAMALVQAAQAEGLIDALHSLTDKTP